MKNGRTLIITGLSQLIYSLGLNGVDFQQIMFVNLRNSESERLGNRSQQEEEKHALQVAKATGKGITFINFREIAHRPEWWDTNSLVDIQLLVRRSRGDNKKTKQEAIALQPELVSLVIPKILSKDWLRKPVLMRKRLHFLYRFILRTGIKDVYLLCEVQKSRALFQQKGIDFARLQYAIKPVVKNYLDDSNEHVKTFERLASKRVLFILPLAENSGGNDSINKILAEEATKIFLKASSEFDLVVVKNHPSDSRNWANCFRNLPESKLVFLTESIDRSIPLELLCFATKSFGFVGVDSTAFIGLSRFVCQDTHVITLPLYGKGGSDDYIFSAQRSLYSHTTTRIGLC